MQGQRWPLERLEVVGDDVQVIGGRGNRRTGMGALRLEPGDISRGGGGGSGSSRSLAEGDPRRRHLLEESVGESGVA